MPRRRCSTATCATTPCSSWCDACRRPSFNPSRSCGQDGEWEIVNRKWRGAARAVYHSLFPIYYSSAMRISTEQLQQHLARELKPLYTVFGDEALLGLEASDRVRARARTDGYTERDVLTVDSG